MKILLIISILFLLSCTKEVINENIKKQVLTNNSEPYKMQDGEYVKYFNNGSIAFKTFYKSNKLNGKFIKYFKNGNIKEIGKFKNNKKDGLFKVFYNSGQLMSIKNYKSGKIHGEYIIFYKNVISS